MIDEVIAMGFVPDEETRGVGTKSNSQLNLIFN